MLDHPWHHCVIGRDVLPDLCPETQFGCPGEPTDQTYSNLGVPVGLRTVSRRLLIRQCTKSLHSVFANSMTRATDA